MIKVTDETRSKGVQVDVEWKSTRHISNRGINNHHV